jgi:hypothetical protein
MNAFLRQSCVVAALVSYLLGSSLMEIAHHDPTSVMLESHPLVTTHGCGAHEKHLPVDQARHCLACSPFVQRVATGAVHFIGIDPSIVCQILHPAPCRSVSTPDIISSGKRGPPEA